MTFAQIVSVGTGFAATIVLARLLTPYETGIYAVAVATSGFISIIHSLGLQALIIREEVLTPGVSATAFTINALIAVLLSFLIAMASLFGTPFLGDEGVGRVLLALALMPIFGIITFLPSSRLEREGRFKAIALTATAGGIAGAVATMAFALSGLSYMSVAYGQWISGLLHMTIVLWIGRAYVSYSISFTEWRRVAAFGSQMLAVSGVNAASTRLSDIVLGKLLGLEALGFFSRAQGINGLIWNNFHLAAGRVLLVDFAELHRRGESLRARYIKTVEVMTAILWPAFAGLAVLAPHVIYFVYGDQWVPSANLLVMIAIGAMIQVSITMTWELFAATGKLGAQTRIESIRASLSLVLFAGACFISLEAAAATRIIDALLAVAFYRKHLSRMTGTSTQDFWPTYARSSLLVVLAIGPAAIWIISARHNEFLSPLQILVLTGLGVLAWSAGIMALKHPIAEEVRKLLLKVRFKSA